MSLLGERDVTRRRRTGGTRTAGRWTPGSAVDTTIRGSVQPLGGRDRLVLPEGLRQSVGKKVYTAVRGDLRAADQATGLEGDEVVIDGEVYTVVHVDNEHPLIGHDRAFLLRTKEVAP